MMTTHTGTEGDNSSSVFRLSLSPIVDTTADFETMNDIVSCDCLVHIHISLFNVIIALKALAGMSEKFEGVQEVNCSLVL